MADEMRKWDDAMARWSGMVDPAAERARRRDEFAKAALQGMLSGVQNHHTGYPPMFRWANYANEAVQAADAMLAALAAAAGPTSVEVPPAPQSRPAETQAMEGGV